MNLIRRILSRQQLFDDLSEEIRQHIDERTDELTEAGMDSTAARSTAHREFGNTRAIEERGREVWRWPMLEDALFDIRYTIRRLRRHPTFAIVAVLILALGIGASTAVYSLADKILLEPLPFRDAERLTLVLNQDVPGLSNRTSTVATYEVLEQMRSFEELTVYEAFFSRTSYVLAGEAEPDRVTGVMISSNFFPFLGIEPTLGRTFTDEEVQVNGPGAILLSHKLWERRYSSDPAVIGRTVTVNDRTATVVGVMPPELDFGTVFSPGIEVGIYVPVIREVVRDWGNTLQILGRLSPGVSIEAAQAEADAIIAQQQLDHPEFGDRYGAILRPLQDTVTATARRPVLILCAAAGFLLLIACVNLSNLLLARVASRRKEVALHSAIGAGPGRMVRQLVTESLVLSLLGWGLGTVFASFAISIVKTQQGLDIPLLQTVSIDGRVFVVTLCFALVTALFLGVAPSVNGARENLATKLRNDSRTSGRSRDRRTTQFYLSVSQVALACVLLVGAGLLSRSFLNLNEVDLGFRAEDIQTLRVDAGENVDTPEKFFAYVQDILAAARSVPGVEAASLTDAVPFGSNRSSGVRAEGQSREETIGAILKVIAPDLFRTMRTPFVAGRDFSNRDDADSPPVVIINESLARRLWPGEDPLNKSLQTFRGPRQVVGVVADVRHLSVEASSGPEFYVPILQSATNSPSLVVRTDGPFAAVASRLRSALAEAVPNLPTGSFVPLQLFVDRAVSLKRFFLGLVAAFAGSSLLLASIGIYGVISYSVIQRTHEIGVRIALGGSRRHIFSVVLSETVRLILYGSVIGIFFSTVLSTLMSSLLFEVSPIDPGVYAWAMAVLIFVTIIAGLIPAARATRIPPVTALRTE